MLITNDQSSKKNNSDSCTVWEYNFPSQKLGIARSKINGRYPKSGKAINTECDMIYYTIAGNGTIYHQKGTFDIQKGDSFFFEKNKWYRIDGKDLDIIITTTPTRYPDQYKNI